jgi:hypothetical protein
LGFEDGQDGFSLFGVELQFNQQCLGDDKGVTAEARPGIALGKNPTL